MIVRVEFFNDVYLSVAKAINAKLIPHALYSNAAYYFIDSDGETFISEDYVLQCIENCANVENVDHIDSKTGKMIENVALLVLSGGNSSFDLNATKQKLHRYIFMYERCGKITEHSAFNAFSHDNDEVDL